jgi:hypothetical protein
LRTPAACCIASFIARFAANLARVLSTVAHSSSLICAEGLGDRGDGTWTMLPIEENTTHGHWHIDGNQYFDTAAMEPPETTQYTIILITKKDFVFTDQAHVFYETRLK